MTENGHTSAVMEDRFTHSTPTRDGDGAAFTSFAKFIAGLGVMSVFAASAPTSGITPSLPGPADAWHETSVVLSSAAAARERRVTLAEARSMALRVLREADERRARQAEDDARVPFFWESE